MEPPNNARIARMGLLETTRDELFQSAIRAAFQNVSSGMSVEDAVGHFGIAVAKLDALIPKLAEKVGST